MKIETLREFIVFSRHLHFGHAAQELHFSQSALSTHIMALEEEVGVRLVHRGAEPSLTEAGSHFLAYAYSTVTDYDTMIRETRLLGSACDAVRIDDRFGDESFTTWLSKSVSTPFEVVDKPTRGELWGLESGEVDAMFCVDLFSSDCPDPQPAAACSHIGSFAFDELETLMFMSRDNPLASRADTLTREDVDTLPVLVFTGSCVEPWRACVEKALGRRGQARGRVRYVPYVDETSVLSCDVKDELLVLTGKHRIARALRARGDLVVADRLDGAPLLVKRFVYHRTDATGAARAFVEELRGLAAQPRRTASD